MANKSPGNERLQTKINNLIKKKVESSLRGKIEQNYEVKHIEICAKLANELISFIKYESFTKEELEKEVQFEDGKFKSIKELLADTMFIKESLADSPAESLEYLFNNLYDVEDKTINIIGLIESYLISDLKSDLTEEYAWYFDYIRNIMDNEEKDALLEKVKDILKKQIDEGFSKEEKGKEVRRTLKDTIGAAINENQKKYGFKEVFNLKNQTKIYKKATGGLPDAVSINKEGKISFTAANSLTTLQMEYDQIERHGAVIAIGIYDFETKSGITLKETINGDNENLKKKIGESISLAFSEYSTSDSQRDLYLSLNNPDSTKEKEIKEILQEKVEVTFFQTYTSKNIPRTLLESLIKSNEETSDESYKPKDEEVKEGYREINHMTSFLLANAQTIHNQDSYEGYDKSLMDGVVSAKNLKSQPKNSKTFKKNNEEFSNYIVSKVDKGESLESWLSHLVKVNKKTELENNHQGGANLLELLSIDDLSMLLNSEKMQKIENQTKDAKISKSVRTKALSNKEEHKLKIEDLKKLYISHFGSDKDMHLKGKLTALKKHIDKKRTPLETLDEDKDYNIIDMSIINMLKSSNVLRIAAIIGVTNVLKEKAINSNNKEEIEKYQGQYKIVKEYGKSTINNTWEGDAKIIKSNEIAISDHLGKFAQEENVGLKKDNEEKDSVIEEKDFKSQEKEFLKAIEDIMGNNEEDKEDKEQKEALQEALAYFIQVIESVNPLNGKKSKETKLIKNIKLSELLEKLKDKILIEDILKNNFNLLYEEFKTNDQKEFDLISRIEALHKSGEIEEERYNELIDCKEGDVKSINISKWDEVKAIVSSKGASSSQCSSTLEKPA